MQIVGFWRNIKDRVIKSLIHLSFVFGNWLDRCSFASWTKVRIWTAFVFERWCFNFIEFTSWCLILIIKNAFFISLHLSCWYIYIFVSVNIPGTSFCLGTQHSELWDVRFNNIYNWGRTLTLWPHLGSVALIELHREHIWPGKSSSWNGGPCLLFSNRLS